MEDLREKIVGDLISLIEHDPFLSLYNRMALEDAIRALNETSELEEKTIARAELPQAQLAKEAGL